MAKVNLNRSAVPSDNYYSGLWPMYVAITSSGEETQALQSVLAFRNSDIGQSYQSDYLSRSAVPSDNYYSGLWPMYYVAITSSGEETQALQSVLAFRNSDIGQSYQSDRSNFTSVARLCRVTTIIQASGLCM